MKAKIILLAAVAMLASSFGHSYTLQYNNGVFNKWPSTAQIKMSINTSFPTPSAFNNSFLVQSVIQHVEREWNTVLAAQGIGVRYVDGGLTTTVSNIGCDGTNVVTFSDTTVPLAAGVLAYAVLQPAPIAGAVACGTNADGSQRVITAQFVGQILDADITINRNLAFSPYGLYIGGNSQDLANDIEGTVLHEMGHVLGLHHSGMINAVMVAGSQQGYPNRTLSTDDIAGINAAYGTNAPGGALTGKIVDSLLGQPICAANVVATNATTGFTTAGALSDCTGLYNIVGLPPATYKVTVAPLNNYPYLPGNFPAGLVATPSLNFNAVFAGPVTVGQGSATLNITVPTVSTPASFQSFGVALSFSSQSGSAVSAPRGGTFTICAYGSSLTGEITLSAPASQVAPQNATTTNVGQLCGSAQYARTFTSTATATPGAFDVYIGNGVMPGGFTLTTNPQVASGGIVDGAGFTKTAGAFAAGGFISIFGTDFATDNFGVLDFPVPTQLGGISVRIGDRFAPLFFVGTGQINAMIPYEVTGTADVQVLSGDNSVFDAGNLTIAASAPRIFTSNSSGSGQGAILNQNNSANSASNPEAAGNVIQIYCMGLGQTTPAAITGIAVPSSISGGAAQISGALNVQIGGRAAPSVQYKGIAPGFVGLYQVNVNIPAGLGTQSAATITITDANGNTSNMATVAVK